MTKKDLKVTPRIAKIVVWMYTCSKGKEIVLSYRRHRLAIDNKINEGTKSSTYRRLLHFIDHANARESLQTIKFHENPVLFTVLSIFFANQYIEADVLKLWEAYVKQQK